jgi:hypothetical protein
MNNGVAILIGITAIILIIACNLISERWYPTNDWPQNDNCIDTAAVCANPKYTAGLGWLP